jgi:LuxR family maltose regulon positive regulatory protein
VPATLLKTKLYIPPDRPNLVERLHLQQQINQGLNRKLTLVSAPPGFGKTTLISTWIRRHLAEIPAATRSQAAEENLCFAWLSIDQQDNDPVRFWTYVISALSSAQPEMKTEALSLISEPQAPPLEEILAVLINTIAELPAKVVVVLDDYHLIDSKQIHRSLSFFLDHLPPQLHLIITSRSDPPLPLTRLRVRGQLTELRDSDLRFSPAEAAVFINQVMGIDLSPEAVSALETRTEGWIAGLQLAALSMQGRADAQRFVQAFTGSHRYIIDYLAEEVLHRQPDYIRTFLLHTSILDRLCGPLCDSLLEAVNLNTVTPLGQEILEQLEQANLFLIPLDDNRRWYRYHHLFADFLREHLAQTAEPDVVTTLHKQASRWLETNHLITEAVNHSLAAGATGEATRLVERVLIDSLTSGEVTTVLNWLDALPDQLIRTRPRLSLGKGWALLITNRWDQIEPLLEAAETALAELKPGDPELSQGWSDTEIKGMWGEVAAMRAMVYGSRGDAQEAIRLCEQALQQLPPENATVRGIILMTLGNAHEVAGDLPRASQAHAEAVAICRSTGDIIVALTATSTLARIESEQGNLYAAAEYFRQGIEIVNEQFTVRGETFPGARWAYIELAELYREWNELDEAKRLLTVAFEMPRQINMLGGNLGIAYIILASILQAEGDNTGALDAIDQARRTMPETFSARTWVGAVEARLNLIQGNLDAASRWVQNCNLPISEDELDFLQQPHYVRYPGEYTTLVRVYIAQQRSDEALNLLELMQQSIERTQRWGRLVDIFLLRALALQAKGSTDQALATFMEALKLGERGGYVRLFADEGAPVVALLRLAHARQLTEQTAYIDKLLAAATTPAIEHGSSPASSSSITQPLIEPLSNRELEVLSLVAQGLSNREIAEQLFITVGTAKTHTINIYRKLDVNSRTQAVARAQELKLL